MCIFKKKYKKIPPCASFVSVLRVGQDVVRFVLHISNFPPLQTLNASLLQHNSQHQKRPLQCTKDPADFSSSWNDGLKNLWFCLASSDCRMEPGTDPQILKPNVTH